MPRECAERKASLAAAALLATVLCLPRLSSELAFARRHVFPVGVRELRQRLETAELSQQEYSSTLASLQDAYEAEILKWGQRKNWEKALTFLKEMQDFDYQPGVPAYAAAIRACGDKVKEWPRALTLLQEMEEKSLTPDTNAFHWALAACSKDRKWGLAVSVLRDMQRRGVPEDKQTLMAALHACSYGGLWEDAINIIEDMDAKGFDPLADAFNKAMDACLVAKEDEWFDVIEDKAASRGFEMFI
eukprot:gb/GFBE01015214.1/.p1 GENE.gb/GFBE01015214.1/~~gb/GFBE01015214.1/.p1  ORF type:complete len:245 (+),score=60.22 gb/GFBE01015214.1/:1-735(+)